MPFLFSVICILFAIYWAKHWVLHLVLAGALASRTSAGGASACLTLTAGALASGTFASSAGAVGVLVVEHCEGCNCFCVWCLMWIDATIYIVDASFSLA